MEYEAKDHCRREWRSNWESEPTNNLKATSQGYSPFVAKMLKDLDELLQTQDQVNTMMLAALDELKQERDAT